MRIGPRERDPRVRRGLGRCDRCLAATRLARQPESGTVPTPGPAAGSRYPSRVWVWREQRERRDAEIRETLRAAYGKSSLRLDWSTLDETAATAHDEARLAPLPQLLELGAAPTPASPELDTASVDLAWPVLEIGDGRRRW